MKINNKTIKFVVLMVVLMAVLAVAKTEAASGFPEIMSGMTTVTINGQKVYGGLGGNYAILNNDSNSSYGFKISAANTFLWQQGCLNQTFVGVSGLCFILGTGTLGQGNAGTGRLMTAKTTVDGATVYEIPALLFNGVNINGDVSGSLSYLLRFWSPANLYKGGDLTDGNIWNLGSYAFNPAAQVVRTSSQFSQYHDKMLTLAGSAANVPEDTGIFTTGGLMYLQGSNIMTDSLNSESGSYPDGKVWSVNGGLVDGNVTIAANKKITFKGVGTIIIKGNLTVGSGASFVPADASSRLGIIVLHNNAGGKGSCVFSGGNTVSMMTYCENTLSASNNSLFIGSFVANQFNITGNSLQFTYDPAFDSSQPPGFRNLAMPGMEEVGNQ